MRKLLATLTTLSILTIPTFFSGKTEAADIDEVIKKLEQINGQHIFLQEALTLKYKQMLFQHNTHVVVDHFYMIDELTKKNIAHRKNILKNIEYTSERLSQLNQGSDIGELINELHHIDFLSQNLTLQLHGFSDSLNKLNFAKLNLEKFFQCADSGTPQSLFTYNFLKEYYNPSRLIANPIATIDDSGDSSWNPIGSAFEHDHWYESAIHIYFMPASMFVDLIFDIFEDESKRLYAREVLNEIIEKNNHMYKEMGHESNLDNELKRFCSALSIKFNTEKVDGTSLHTAIKNMLAKDDRIFKDLESQVEALKLQYNAARAKISDYEDRVNESLRYADQIFGNYLDSYVGLNHYVRNETNKRSLVISSSKEIRKEKQDLELATEELLENIVLHNEVNSFRELTPDAFQKNDIFENWLRGDIK